ncbi:hypothetical protein [Paraburkholderia sp. JHI869]|uniref:hypothetical protein n=1 Tax=Paraburkholderia sp. JHI869 TaxID=3112959 RepID=UPI00317E12B0
MSFFAAGRSRCDARRVTVSFRAMARVRCVRQSPSDIPIEKTWCARIRRDRQLPISRWPLSQFGYELETKGHNCRHCQSLADKWSVMKYFVHVPKTAGTSLGAAVFGAQSATSSVYPIYSGLNKRMADEARSSLTSDSVVFGHFAFGAHVLFGDKNPTYATVMRDPLERVVSLYRHHARFDSSPYFEFIKKEKLSLRDFVESCVTPETNNEMVRIFSASYRYLPLLEDRLANHWWSVTKKLPTRQINEGFRLRRALKNLDKYFSHIGFVDELPQTADFLAKWLGVSQGGLVIARENVFPGPREELSAGDRRVIENANELDLELFGLMRQRGRV